MSEAKTEEATPRHERRARERGRAWQSRDLAFGAVLLASGALLRLGAARTQTDLEALFTGTFTHLSDPIAPRVALVDALTVGMTLALPWLAAVVGIGAFVSAVQVGGLFAPGAITPDASRLDPSARFGGSAGARAGSTLLLGLARFALVIAVVIWTCVDAMPGIATLSRQPPSAALAASFTMAAALALRTGLALVAFGVLDAIVERTLHRSSLRMSRREREREQRDAEGDAHLRRERERVREEQHRADDLDEVRSAALVVTTDDLAVAISYDASDPDAVPRVVAIARGERAIALRREAAEHDVRSVIDASLAERLAIVAAGDVIPEALYEPVARAMKRGAGP